MADAAPPMKAIVERDGVVVRVILNCNSIYDAMMLYDNLTRGMRMGCMSLEVSTKPPNAGSGS